MNPNIFIISLPLSKRSNTTPVIISVLSTVRSRRANNGSNVFFFFYRDARARVERDREDACNSARFSYAHMLLASSEFRRMHRGTGEGGGREGVSIYRRAFISRNIFTSPARCTAPVGSLKFNDGAENIHSPRGRGNKWLTLTTSGKEKKRRRRRRRKREKGRKKNEL